jgi:hypothetical protein
MGFGERRTRKLTPMTGELTTGDAWTESEPATSRPRRKKKATPATRHQVLLRGIARLAAAIVLLSLIAIASGLLLVLFFDESASRAIPLGFYLTGSFVAIGGFLHATGGSRYAVVGNQAVKERAIGSSISYGALGVAVILVGAGLDAVL